MVQCATNSIPPKVCTNCFEPYTNFEQIENETHHLECLFKWCDCVSNFSDFSDPPSNDSPICLHARLTCLDFTGKFTFNAEWTFVLGNHCERHNPYMERCLEFFGKKGREKRDPAGSVHVCRTGSRLYPIWEAMLRRTTDQKHRLKMSVALTEQSNCENVPTEEVTCPVIKKAKVLVEDEVTIRFAKLNSDAHTPTSGSACAAGADLYSAEDCIVPSKGKYCVSTGIQVELPYGYYGRVAPRSGLAAKHFIDVGAGVVDSDYRGELKVLLFNFNDADFQVKKGDRIAQFICERIAHTRYVEVDSLTDTDRGAGGFGSTGK